MIIVLYYYRVGQGVNPIFNYSLASFSEMPANEQDANALGRLALGN
jgi:hypothetical protein